MGKNPASGKQKRNGTPAIQSSAIPSRHGIPREFLNAYPDPCILVQDETILEVNDQAVSLLQRKREDILGNSFLSFLEPSQRDTLQLMREELSTPGNHSTREVQIRTGAETTATVMLSVSMYLHGASPLTVVVVRDISESKQKELDLLRFSNIAHFTVNPLEITDVNGRIIYVNPAFEKASGYTKEELLGKNPNVFGSKKHPKAFWEKMWKTIFSGQVWTGEIENRKRNGDPFITHLLISPIIDAEKNIVGFFGVHRDITEMKRLEHQLIHAQKMESIGLLAAGLAHEVGNPLTSISSLVQVLQRTTQDEFTQVKLGLIKSQITRISKIIRDLVDFSRKSSYEVELTDVNKCLREAIEIVRVGKKSKEVSFLTELDSELPMLPLVPDQVEQVFINILINAVDVLSEKPSEQSSHAETLHRKNITVTSFTNDVDVVITIHDTGRGISDEHLTKIFEPFFTTKKVGEGTGLGLWVSYGIVKSFQGDITVDSIEGEGTTFTITFPMHPEFS